ncbi:helix-turn-helix domain-containing protein [Peribacillus sp. SCS-155]|uniref:helix-turn-helix domain-containing protein n=1 Tax=Peribacillus sedimenti TaxID=3115297 RepID=UPI003906617A
MYTHVHQLKKQGFKVAAISKKLGIPRNTVYKYLEMSFEEAANWVASLGCRSKNIFLPGPDS